MSLLLETELKDVLIPIIIIAVTFIIAFIIVFALKRVYGKDRGLVTKSEPKVVQVEIIKQYVKPNMLEFLNKLYKVLPAEFIAFPRVGVDNLVKPKNDKILYNSIMSQYIDVCVFLKSNMEPILAIDLYEASPVDQQMKELHPNVIKALKTVNIPLLSYQLSEEYDIIELRTRVIDAMPAKVVALLKEKVKNGQ